MRRVGQRLEPELAAAASGTLLAQGARFSEDMAGLARLGFMPKGVYRYRSHLQANEHELACLAQRMGQRAVLRG